MMDEHIIELSYNGHKFCLEAVDPDLYSTIELMREYTKEISRQPISPPNNPTLFYIHPKSKKCIEICNDTTLLNMFKAFFSTKTITVYVRDAANSVLMDMWRTYEKDQSMMGVQKEQQVEILELSPPPATQPCTQPPPLLPQSQLPTPQSRLPTPVVPKRKHKKKGSRGLTQSYQLPIHQIETPSQLPITIAPTVANFSSKNDTSSAATLQSVQTSNSTPRSREVHTSLVITSPRMDVISANKAPLSGHSLEQGDGSAIGDARPDDEVPIDDNEPTYSDDSWSYKDVDEGNDFETESSNSEDNDIEDDDDRLEELQGITECGYYSADDEDCAVKEPPYLRNGTQFEYQADGTVVLQSHQMFENKKTFLEVMKDYACQEGIDLHRVSNDPFKYTVKCNNNNTCPWRLHASLLPDKTTFMIKTLTGEHDCMRIANNPNATVPWITKKILPDIRANKKMVPKDIIVLMRQKFSVELSYIKCYRAQKLALRIIDGNHDESYARIPQYCKIALDRNPGSIIDLQYQEYMTSPPSFTRLFICFHAQKEGFLRGCRPFIGVDGCHLKGPFGGVLLTAIAIDGNNGIFPIAFSVVQSESTNTWKYFFSQLKKIADWDTRKRWVIISDRQKGVDPALKDEMPEVTRRICCRHLYANLKKDYPGVVIRNLFWEAAKAYTETSLDGTLKTIKENSVSAYNYLKNVDFDLWVRYHIPEYTKVIEVTSNFVESFNSKLSDIRSKPILAMLDELRRSMMLKMHKRRENSVKLRDPVTSYASKILHKNTRLGRSCAIRPSSDIEFEVSDIGGYFIVNLRDHHCDCMSWDLSGIPCKHACAVIAKQRIDPVSFVTPWFSKELYVETYKEAISPIPDPNMWPTVVGMVQLKPPFLRKLPGRPKKNRRREQGEAPPVTKRSNHVTCAICKRIGHNSKTCRSQKDRGHGPNSGGSQTSVVQSTSKYKRKRNA